MWCYQTLEFSAHSLFTRVHAHTDWHHMPRTYVSETPEIENDPFIAVHVEIRSVMGAGWKKNTS